MLEGVAFIEVPSEEPHSVHVSYIKLPEELIPKNVEVLLKETYPNDPITYRVIFRKNHA